LLNRGGELIFLKKKPQEGEKNKGEIPNELPPLEAEAKGSGQKEEDVPDELPNLDLDSGADDGLSSSMSSGSGSNLPDLMDDSRKESQEGHEGITGGDGSEVSEEYPSFFGKVVKENGVVAGGNMLSAMKQYWEKNKILEVAIKSETLREMENALQGELSKLKNLEKRWLMKMQELNSTKHYIANLEAEISIHSEELAVLAAKAGKYKKYHKDAKDIMFAEKDQSQKKSRKKI
jgi:hypothetical protein